MFEIIKNLPIPETKKTKTGSGRESIYPFRTMEIGDCLAFNAENVKDPVYKKIYGSAMSFARRAKEGYSFKFAMIETGKFGCWKVANEKLEKEQPEAGEKRNRKNRVSPVHITKDTLIQALENAGTLSGASNMLGVSTRTLSRLKQKFELV